MKIGAICVKELMSISFENTMPIPIPNSEDVVKRETCLPTISPRLFLFAKVTLIYALDAEDINMQIFLPIFAVEAKKRNIPGN